MKKSIILSSLFVSLLAMLVFQLKKSVKLQSDISFVSTAEDADEEDGIRAAQEMEFERTKDISLGFIPQSRLITAYEDLLRTRRMQGNARTGALSWTERGPNSDAVGPSNGNGRPGNGVTSGRIRAVWVDLADLSNHTVWVGGVDGGLWKTNDISAAPATWTPVNDFFGNLAVGSICQDPSNTNIMYFGTGEKAFNVDAVRGGGIWKSTDHGVSWSLLGSTTGFWNVSKILCDASGNVYVATIGSGAGIQRSVDGGTNWTNITPTGLSNRVSEMEISSTGRMHITCGYYNTAVGSAGYRYTDNPSTVTAGTWNAATTSFSPVQYNVDIATAGNTLYALNADASFETSQIWKSTDGGDHWANTVSTPPTTGSTPLSSGQGWYCLSIAVDPANPNKVMVGGLNSYLSTDGGANWSVNSIWVTGVPGSSNYIHADHQASIWNGNQVLAVSDGGIFYSADGGLSFADRNIGLRLKQFYSCAIHPSSTNYFLAGAQDNGTHQLSSAGLGSSVEVVGGDGAFTHIDQDEPQYQYGAYVYGQYRRSTNSGASWSAVNYTASGTNAIFINPTDFDDYNNIMYTSGPAGQYVRWDNPHSGSTFTPVSVAAFAGGRATHIMVSPYTSNRVFFGTSGGKIIRADDAHTASPTVSDITGGGMSASTVSCIALGTDDNNLLATFSNYGATHVWVTTNGGTGWTNVTGNLPDIPVRWALFYPDDNTQAILATEMGIYETAALNGGATVWVQNSGFPVVRTDMLQYRKSDGTVAAATHGRGLWTTTIPLTPHIRFATPYITNTESTTSTIDCRGYTDYTIDLNIDAAPTGDANVTVSVNGSPTAAQGQDFDFTTNGNFAAPSTAITFSNGSTASHTISIRIYDDEDIEADETFRLTFSLSGATNAAVAPSGQYYDVTITDNDAAPVSGGTGLATIGTGDYPGGYIQPFRSSYPKARSQYIYLASELSAAGLSAGNITTVGFNVLSKTSTAPYNGLTISLKNTLTSSFSGTFETGTTACYSANYSTVSGINNISLSTPFAWDGSSNLLVEICYDNVAGSGSGDAVSSNVSVDDKGLWNRDNVGTGCSLAAVYASAGASFVRPDILLTGVMAGNNVETVLNASKTANLGPNSDVYFYNSNGNIIARIHNLSSYDYGCTQVIVDRAGSSSVSFWNNNIPEYLTSKTFHVVPTNNSPGVSDSYQLTLYYTDAEKTGWEAATGQSWGSIQMVKVDGQISQVTPGNPTGGGNVSIVTPTVGSFGSDHTLTYTFTGGFSGFAAGIPGTSPLPVTLLNFDGQKSGKHIRLSWSTGSEQNAHYFLVEKSTDGSSFFTIGKVSAAGNSNRLLNYDFTDTHVNENNYYRLRMVDIDGHFIFSRTVLIRNPGIPQNLWLVTNPFQSQINLRLARQPLRDIRVELLNVSGARVYEGTYGSATVLSIDVSRLGLSKGVYLLRTVVDGELFVNKLVKQ
ncbi:MAG: hypothetical protein GC171_16110 [Terrimonas sp.]|nr:hypothetical protein [Terrimonas sp.]